MSLIPHKADAETRAERVSICDSCEHLIRMTKQCRKCGCFMPAKTWIAEASCPLQKWKSVK